MKKFATFLLAIMALSVALTGCAKSEEEGGTTGDTPAAGSTNGDDN